MPDDVPAVRIYFSDYFGVSPEVLKEGGAFNVSLINDLPLFIDPFLLFNSTKEEYQKLHQDIIRYVTFLRDRAAAGPIGPGLLKAWFYFPEVKQTWLGFSRVGNAGTGLGAEFAAALSKNLGTLFTDFGQESVTKGSHVEKLCLIDGGVGRDNISDFTTNLIKHHLLEFTQQFAREHLADEGRRTFRLEKVSFNYETSSWQAAEYELPCWGDDFVILTPRDMLTKDDTWISRHGLFRDFDDIVAAVPDDQLREQLNFYLASRLPRSKTKEPSREEIHAAIRATIEQYPAVLDHYIRQKEDDGGSAVASSSRRVEEVEEVFIRRVVEVVTRLHRETAFYDTAGDTLEEARARVLFLKDVIENKDGHRIFYGTDGAPLRREEVVQLLFRLTWYASPSDVNREVNNARGPVDYKISRGAKNAALVEFKLASNTKLKVNLQHQVEVYKRASGTSRALKVIVAFSDAQRQKVARILADLGLEADPDVIIIDAEPRKKLSASNVRAVEEA
jgi:hypothetical protein